MAFSIDPKILADSVPVTALRLSDVRLMTDARYPWLLLVPRTTAEEIVDLEPGERAILLDEIAAASAALRTATSCHKLNVAALGNVVRQLHIHVIARFTDDASWPRPVWGVGQAVAYEPAKRDRLVADIGALLAT